MKLYGVVLSDEGRVRKNNEDNFNLFGKYRTDVNINKSFAEGTSDIKKAYAAVYDGMGGEAAGEVASLIAAAGLSGCSMNDVYSHSSEQIMAVNAGICDEIKKRGKRVGTTSVALYFDDNQAVCCNVGDSRAYLFRNGQLKQLSKDHSLGQRLIDSGQMTEEEARKSNNWHKLSQHFGIFPEEFMIEPYMTNPIVLQENDLFLLCSDGLTDTVYDPVIGDILGKDISVTEKAKLLLNEAFVTGSKDNVTVMLVSVVSDDNPIRPDSEMSRKETAENGGSIVNKVLPIVGIVFVLAALLVVGLVVVRPKLAEKFAVNNVEQAETEDITDEEFGDEEQTEDENAAGSSDFDDSEIEDDSEGAGGEGKPENEAEPEEESEPGEDSEPEEDSEPDKDSEPVEAITPAGDGIDGGIGGDKIGTINGPDLED